MGNENDSVTYNLCSRITTSTTISSCYSIVKKRTRRKSSPTKNETIETKSKNARRRKGIKRASESSIRTSHEKITACKTKKISSTRTRKEKRNSITQKAKTNTRKKGRASQKRGS